MADRPDKDRPPTRNRPNPTRRIPTYQKRESDHPPSRAVDWLPVLSRLSISPEEAARLQTRAGLTGVPFQTELLASGIVSEEALFRELARELGIEFCNTVSSEDLIIREWQGLAALAAIGGVRAAMMLDQSGRSIVLMAPDRLNIPAMKDFLRRYPRVSKRIRIVAPSMLRARVARRMSRVVDRHAVSSLFETAREYSARFVLDARQAAILGGVSVALVFTAVLAPFSTLLAIHIALSFIFLSCVIFRLLVTETPPPPRPSLNALQPSDMPVYTVLVALYQEAEIVPDLLVALGRLVWPRAKLEIKLVCESDDEETLAALKAQNLRPYIEIIEVPPGHPRTKPKALSYALPLTSGEFVVLFDAEDRPHPFQLVEAWQRFERADANLICLQAPLSIANSTESWVSSMFALEYAALFRQILPWLARTGTILPLGGTSNHFRRGALQAVGGWDPYNVTEDADLGTRLARLGYKCGVITHPTFEDAPTDIKTWLPQRTRWFKGWAQTWLVHMRHPRQLLQQIGVRSFLTVQILFLGMLLSALTYSLFLVTIAGIALYAIHGGSFAGPHKFLMAVDAINIVFGHAAFLWLGWRALSNTERRTFWKRILWTPVYWGIMSAAGWRCLWQLYKRPHYWAKTPHKRYRRDSAEAVRGELRQHVRPTRIPDL